MNTLSVSPAGLSRELYLADGVTRLEVKNPAPRVLELTALTGFMFASFTPTGTTVTVYFDEENPHSCFFTAATPRVNYTEGVALSQIRHFRATLGRKPGSTGAIAAQVVKLQGWNGAAYEEVARFNVLAAAAGEQPVADFLDLPKAAGDSRFYFFSDHPFKFIFESADADIEVSFEAYGLS
jgi:hypothetical protein